MSAAAGPLIEWIKKRRVLHSHLSTIAREQGKRGNRGELMCTVIDLLDPQRDARSAQMLKSMGVSVVDANNLWSALRDKDSNWLHTMNWSQFGRDIRS